MRDYQAKRNDWRLPDYAYRQALAVVRGYPEMLALLQDSARRDRIVSMMLRRQVDAVESALAEVPKEYRDGVLHNLIEQVPLDRLPYAERKTWSRWRGRYLYEVARQLHLV